ncbi:siderochrome-iron transporter [Apiospora kogelbergensis]|uniref:Siderochrome-iron transporter n=1 Tax=Apiospora kogelbergensis TaxID=1337665 RepID=A0AAW0R6B6_9PEZI
MAFAQKIKAMALKRNGIQRSSSSTAAVAEVSRPAHSDNAHADGKGNMGSSGPENNVEAGVSAMAAAQAIWGKTGFRLVILGFSFFPKIHTNPCVPSELDNSTVYTYKNYSTSEFNQLSVLGTLNTAAVIVFAVVKPPIAKISNVIGRGYTLVFTISCYVLSYILMASAQTIGAYAGGFVLYNIGQSGTNVMTNVILTDLFSPRWRAFAIGVSFFPFLITPWVAAFIVASVVAGNGIGWRWGIGMFAILMPFGSSFIIGTLLYYQRKAKKMGVLVSQKMTLHEFCSEIDLGGMLLFVGGLACLLLPLTFAAQLPEGWRSPWIIALLVIGIALLVCLGFYEKYVAVYPVMPPSYFKNLTISVSLLMLALDNLGFSATHTYLYSWSIVSYNLDVRTATFLNSTMSVMQCLVGITAGWWMGRSGRYKWLVVLGACIRLIGYGIMIRLRTQDSTIGELFAQQLIQGTGSGIISTALLVVPTTVVPRAQIPQLLALALCCVFLGSSIGSTIAGGIYTNTMRESLWKWLGLKTSPVLIESLYNSITGELPDWGTPERIAINYAYSDIVTYITYAAIGAAAPGIILALLLPNKELPE